MNEKNKHIAKVIDMQTGLTVGKYSTIKRARNKADKLDLKYGAYRYKAVFIKLNDEVLKK